ncbi:hypothetical protein [Vibrio fluvialis]|uniref:hypothetical protein n=1 Tax=Vibrio fluvialis TaxID=676 RepID=UPI0023AA0714|nr:hypothetical protein [Vibrio fluvialis]MDE5179068.1 hypothetical protein [Vibrio fluvialis]
MANTEHSEQKAIVKEDSEGRPYIVFELLRGEEIPLLKQRTIGLRLEDKASIEDATSLAKHINSLLATLFITKF